MKIPELPKVGDRIRQDFGPGNQSTWRHTGTVRAIVDEYIVLRRYSPKRGHFLELIEPTKWFVWRAHYVVTPKRKTATRES